MKPAFLSLLRFGDAGRKFRSGITKLQVMPRRDPGDRPLTRDTLSQSDLKRIAEQIDQWTRIEETDRDTSRSHVAYRGNARCPESLVWCRTPRIVEGARYRQHLYEAACEDGMGYLLVLHGTTLTGTSCLATGHDDSPMKCELPANADRNAMAGTVLKRTRHRLQGAGPEMAWYQRCESGSHRNCLRRRWRLCDPQSASGIERQTRGLLGCQDAVKHGIACELSREFLRGLRPAPAPDPRSRRSRKRRAETEWAANRSERASSDGNQSSGITWWIRMRGPTRTVSSPSCRPQATR